MSLSGGSLAVRELGVQLPPKISLLCATLTFIKIFDLTKSGDEEKISMMLKEFS